MVVNKIMKNFEKSIFPRKLEIGKDMFLIHRLELIYKVKLNCHIEVNHIFDNK